MLCLLLLCTLLSACGNWYTKSYLSYVNARSLHDVRTLSDTETPQVYSCNDLPQCTLLLRSKGYIPIGASSFNAKLQSKRRIIDQAKDVGAVVVISDARYVATSSMTVEMAFPRTQTTYTSGTISDGRNTATYSGTSTTSASSIVPITLHEDIYHQAAVFFVQSTKKLRFGLELMDMPPELRVTYEHNYGPLIEIIRDNSPAFIANLLPGDLILEMNGAPMASAKQAGEFMRDFPLTETHCTVKIQRNKTLMDILLLFQRQRHTAGAPYPNSPLKSYCQGGIVHASRAFT
jgi:hypothetical protein